MKIVNCIVLMLCVFLIMIQNDGQQLLIDGWRGLSIATIVLVMLAVANMISALNDLENRDG